MDRSETIGHIASGLREIQKQLPAVGKDSDGYGYKYASLPEVCRKLYPLMDSVGLSVSQILDGWDGPAITTILMHESGEYISGTYPLHEAGMKGVNSAQQFGAAISYARRYGLLSVLGVPADDDDAACLNQKEEKKEANKPSEREKVLNLVKSVGDVDALNMLYKKHLEAAKSGEWYNDLFAACQKRKAELSG